MGLRLLWIRNLSFSLSMVFVSARLRRPSPVPSQVTGLPASVGLSILWMNHWQMLSSASRVPAHRPNAAVLPGQALPGGSPVLPDRLPGSERLPGVRTGRPAEGGQHLPMVHPRDTQPYAGRQPSELGGDRPRTTEPGRDGRHARGE